MKKFFIFILVLLIIGGGVFYWRKTHKKLSKDTKVYRTANVVRTTITQEVTATGTIKPLKEVEVGTQVTGKIIKLNVDFNSQVNEGDVVAEIDPDNYKSVLASNLAQLQSNKATLERTQASLRLAEKELVRAEALLAKDMISEAEYDAALAERDQLLAQAKGNQAAIDTAEANVKQAQINLNYCSIVSPVTGIVISRDVSEGQTVVSNMSASALFTIANDLSKLKVEASVPEADIGQLKVGQKVNFTVDAYRDTFVGYVSQIRLAAATQSNVVTYPVIVEAENPDLKLFPGMTATLSIIIDEAKDCLAIPAAALRFKPTFADNGQMPPAGAPPKGMPEGAGAPPKGMPEGAGAPPKGMPEGAGAPPKGMPECAPQKGDMPEGMPEGAGAPGAGAPGAGAMAGQTVWLAMSSTTLVPVQVKIGVNDSINYQLLEGDLKEGDPLATGVMSTAEVKKATEGTQNPFTMRPPGMGKGGNKRSGNNSGSRGNGAGGPPPPH